MRDICKDCKQIQEHIYWGHKKRARFYIAMIGKFSQRMCIPEKFMSEIGESLLEVVDLRSPSGSVWHVGLTKSARKVFLQYGWSEFVEAHHLEENDVLFFEYEGDSSFHVLMFDSSKCERESSYFSQNQHSKNRKETEDSSLAILEPNAVATHEVFDCCSDGNPNTGNILEESLPSNNGHRGESSCSRRKIQKGQTVLLPKQEFVGESQLENQSGHRKSAKRSATEPDRNDPMELACSFRTNGPSFVKKIIHYNVNTPFQLLIHSDFAKFLPRKSREIFLRIPSAQKEWEVKYSITEKSVRFIGGWRYFTCDNNLKEGDTCVFVLSKSKKKVSMIVHIFRVADQTSSSSSA